MSTSKSSRPISIDTVATDALRAVLAHRGQLADGIITGAVVIANVERIDDDGSPVADTAVVHLGDMDPRLRRGMLRDVLESAEDDRRWGRG